MNTYLEPPTPCFVVYRYDVLEELIVKLKRNGLVGGRVWFSIDHSLSTRVKVAGDCRTCVSVSGVESDPTGWGMCKFARGEEGREFSELRKEFINFLF